ncbi:hypothetical protein LINPERPRIM_LOCUS20614 [Linum perenne]
MKRSKYLPPGNLRRDAKKPRSFRMLCSDSNPTTDQNIFQNESIRGKHIEVTGLVWMLLLLDYKTFWCCFFQ